jgi:hypothetical protein
MDEWWGGTVLLEHVMRQVREPWLAGLTLFKNIKPLDTGRCQFCLYKKASYSQLPVTVLDKIMKFHYFIDPRNWQFDYKTFFEKTKLTSTSV